MALSPCSNCGRNDAPGRLLAPEDHNGSERDWNWADIGATRALNDYYGVPFV